jgi:hypothetical protein
LEFDMRAASAVAAALGIWTCAAAGQDPAAPAPRPADAEVLSSSELHYSESGGFAGWTHEATLTAAGGRVTVSYRPERSRGNDAPAAGSMPAPRYLELWREAERLNAWSLPSTKAPPGAADMIGHELRLRLGTRTHSVTWVEPGDRMKEAAALGRRILDAGQQFAMNQ